jgi:hypothetical protein
MSLQAHRGQHVPSMGHVAGNIKLESENGNLFHMEDSHSEANGPSMSATQAPVLAPLPQSTSQEAIIGKRQQR